MSIRKLDQKFEEYYERNFEHLQACAEGEIAPPENMHDEIERLSAMYDEYMDELIYIEDDLTSVYLPQEERRLVGEKEKCLLILIGIFKEAERLGIPIKMPEKNSINTMMMPPRWTLSQMNDWFEQLSDKEKSTLAIQMRIANRRKINPMNAARSHRYDIEYDNTPVTSNGSTAQAAEGGGGFLQGFLNFCEAYSGIREGLILDKLASGNLEVKIKKD